MISLLTLVLTVMAEGTSIPVAIFCLEIVLAMLPRRRITAPPFAPNDRVAVLIPAHNEAAVIGATLRTLLPAIPPGGHALVVADNCMDSTAAIARQYGVEAIER